MDSEYLGLTVELLLSDNQTLVGIINAIDMKSKSISLKSVNSFDQDRNLIGEFDLLVVNGSDIIDLEIVEETVVREPISKSDRGQLVDNSLEQRSIASQLENCSIESPIKKQPSELLIEKQTLRVPIKETYPFHGEIPENIPKYVHLSANESSVSSIGNELSSGITIKHKSSLPILSESLFTRILRFTSIMLGPNTTQMMENAARSIIDLIRFHFDISTFTSICFYVDHSRNGAIALAVARMLLILGVQNVFGVSSMYTHSVNLEEKHFNFQSELALKNGFLWLSSAASLHMPCNYVILGLANSDLYVDLSFAKNILSIGHPYCNSTMHVDLILPTSLSVRNSNLFIVDIGISTKVVKKYLQKSLLSTMTSPIDFLFGKSSFVQLI